MPPPAGRKESDMVTPPLGLSHPEGSHELTSPVQDIYKTNVELSEEDPTSSGESELGMFKRENQGQCQYGVGKKEGNKKWRKKIADGDRRPQASINRKQNNKQRSASGATKSAEGANQHTDQRRCRIRKPGHRPSSSSAKPQEEKQKSRTAPKAHASPLTNNSSNKNNSRTSSR